MTGFSGTYALTTDARGAAGRYARAMGERLSRHPGEVVEEAGLGGSLIHHYDIDAWGDGGSWRRTDRAGGDGDPTQASFIKVCGEPVVDGVTGRQASVDALAAAVGDDLMAGLGRTRGTFSMVATDGKSLVLATDCFGSRPVYWLQQDGILAFATNFRTLREAFFDGLTVDASALSELVCLGQPLGDRTPFQEIRVLRPGTVLIARGGEVEVTAYHDWSRATPLDLSWEEAQERVHEDFMQALRRRLCGTEQIAFLSGGMDSRAVVAGLLDLGCAVKTFNSSYPQSADHIIGDIVAKRFGTDHTTSLRTYHDRLKTALDPFALYARRTFFSDASTGQRMWSGDGGSVGLGFVYLTKERADIAAKGPLTEAVAYALFPNLAKGGFRTVRGSKSEEARQRAVAGVLDELKRNNAPNDDKRLFLFYLCNDQMRHLYHHYEDIDRSRVEFITPFFDVDLITSVMRLPTDWFLRHRFYNDFIGRFRTPAHLDPWQSYPGHIPCPLPMPETAEYQWQDSLFEGREARQVRVELARSVLGRRGKYAKQVIHYPWTGLVTATLLLGSDRFGYEIDMAHTLADLLEGGERSSPTT